MSAALHVKSLELRLPDGSCLCHDLSFRIEPGEVLVLMGPSGSGKSSVLGWLTGTLDPQLHASGDCWLGDTQVTQLPTERRRMGLMLQQDYLFPHMSAGENLAFGLRGGSREQRRRIIAERLSEAGLAGMADRDPATLSGGQRARISLLRTLMSNPCALLLDEPFARLDTARREQIRAFTWKAAAQLPVLLVTHDADDIPAGARTLDLAAYA